jgi:hypothetical protein
MENRDEASPTSAVALPVCGRIGHVASAPAGRKAVETAYQAGQGMQVDHEGETLTVVVGDHELLSDFFEGVVIECLQGVCRAPASINSPPSWDARYRVVCIEGHDVTIGPSQVAHVLETRR